MSKFKKPALLSTRELNILRGKSMVGRASIEEMQQVFGHIDTLEGELDRLDCDDFLGTEGWRVYLDYPED